MLKDKKNLVFVSVLAILIATSLIITDKGREEFTVIAGKVALRNISSLPASVQVTSDSSNVKINGGSLNESIVVGAGQPLTIFAEEPGSFTLSAKIFGINIKSIKVNVLPNIMLYPGGDFIGVKINANGLIAVRFSNIVVEGKGVLCPAKDAGILIGDIIRKVNGINVHNSEAFTKEVNKEENLNQVLQIEVFRGGKELTFYVSPEFSKDNNRNLIGLWVKDNVAGIGTLTYVTADMKSYGALGHAITESTTGITVPIDCGDLVGAQILNLVKGKKNQPGEVQGQLPDEVPFGQVTANNDFGIFGDYYGGIIEPGSQAYPIALQSEIHEGDAIILSCIDGSVKEYKIKIEKVNRQSSPNTKSMNIRIVDDNLLKKTGGIIQGMSGSPIIQEGKIIGAVTHVLVNDPTRGYGVFIEWMLENNYN